VEKRSWVHIRLFCRGRCSWVFQCLHVQDNQPEYLSITGSQSVTNSSPSCRVCGETSSKQS
jgi:hypothetical protein